MFTSQNSTVTAAEMFKRCINVHVYAAVHNQICPQPGPGLYVHTPWFTYRPGPGCSGQNIYSFKKRNITTVQKLNKVHLAKSLYVVTGCGQLWPRLITEPSNPLVQKQVWLLRTCRHLYLMFIHLQMTYRAASATGGGPAQKHLKKSGYIACDTCSQWMHYICAGIRRKPKVFNCPLCQ